MITFGSGSARNQPRKPTKGHKFIPVTEQGTQLLDLMRQNAKESCKRGEKVDLMESLHYAERKQRENAMSMFESRNKRKDSNESDFDDEEELGMSISNFSKAYNNSSIGNPHQTCTFVQPT